MTRAVARLNDTETLPPLEVEVEADQPQVRGARKALRDSGTVKVRSKDGDVLFYCLSPSEYRRLKRLDSEAER